MGALLRFAYEFKQLCCYKCGIPFAFSEDFYTRRKNDGEIFFCPAGHSQHFTESENARLKKELRQETERKERALTEANILRQNNKTLERSRAAVSGHLKRTKKRIQNGVCPCCNRHFTNLERHMHSKHPRYTKEETNE